MDKNRKNFNSPSNKMLKKKSVPILNTLGSKSHKYILAKSRNTLEETRDTLNGNKSGKSKLANLGLTNHSCSTQVTEPRVMHINSKLLENRTITDYQNRFSSTDKSPSQKQKIFLKKPKIEGDTKVKARLSLGDKKCKNLSTISFLIRNEEKEINKTSLSNLQELAKQRQNIKKELKRSCKKTKIQKKDLLKISDQYQKLLNRFVFTEMPQNQMLQNYNSQHGKTINLNCLNQSSSSIQIENQDIQVPVKKAKIKNLQLNNLKKMRIQDYNDQFMSHYQELSESWKRDIDIQKRF